MRRLILVVLLTTLPVMSGSVDTDELADLVGYTIIAATHVKGDFEGADYDKQVQLDNGWIFEFRTYHYHYAYHPDAIVFAKLITADQLRGMGIRPISEKPLTTYKLIIDDDAYDVRRIQ